MTYKNVITFCFVLILSCGMAMSPAFADDKPDAGQAKELIQKLGDRALKDLTDKSASANTRKQRMRSILNDYFSMPTIGRFAMGTHWRSASSAQQKEYMKLLEDMVVDTYAARFEEYSGQTFKVTGSTPSSRRDTIVHSKIEMVEDGAPDLAVDWRVRHKNNQYKVVDVIVEGISMSVTQRSDFDGVIQQGGGKVEALIASLKERQNSKP